MIDWQRVDELRDDVGADDFGDVVDLFLEEVAEVIARLAAAPSPDQYEADLHFLKGSALNLGFTTLGAACASGEQLARQGSPKSVDIPTVIAAYDASIAEFNARLGQGCAA